MTQTAFDFDATPAASYTDKVALLFLAAGPGVWIDGMVVAKVGGAYAWRSRISDARRKLQAKGLGTIENKLDHREDGVVLSLYRLVAPGAEATS